MAMLIDILSWVLLTLGGVFVFIGGLGALRMPMGAGTVGLRVGDDLFIGSFHGDRILRVDLSGE